MSFDSLHSIVQSSSPTPRRSSPSLGNAKESITVILTDNEEHEDEESLTRTKKGGLATLSTSIFNLVKSIIGAGVLSLPYGFSVYANDPKALLPAMILCALFGLAAVYSFISIGSLCKETQSSNFRDLWSRSIGPQYAWVISLSITLMCMLSSLAYSIIIGDAFTSLAQLLPLPLGYHSRSTVILVLSITVLLPLCALRSLHALTPFSMLGVLGSVYTGIFMLIRLYDHSYSSGGQYFSDLGTLPSFTNSYTLYNHSSFILLSMLTTSYIAHYNAPRFYHELKNPTPERFTHVVSVAFGISTVFFMIIMCSGFLTFGASTQSFVLNNYSEQDSLAILARLATGLAVITGYPFTFAGFRDGLWELQGTSESRRDETHFLRTVGLLGMLTMLALVWKDVGMIVGLSGSLFGTWLLFIVPSIMNLVSHRRQVQQQFALTMTFKQGMRKPVSNIHQRMDIVLNYLLIAVGVVLMVIGVSVNLQRFVLRR